MNLRSLELYSFNFMEYLRILTYLPRTIIMNLVFLLLSKLCGNECFLFECFFFGMGNKYIYIYKTNTKAVVCTTAHLCPFLLV